MNWVGCETARGFTRIHRDGSQMARDLLFFVGEGRFIGTGVGAGVEAMHS